MFLILVYLFIYLFIYGQVHQTGLLALVSADEVLKLVGSEVIFVTHQPDKFLLKTVAPLNISDILITLLTSQFPIAALKETALLNILLI